MVFHSLWIIPVLATGFAIAAFISGYTIAVGKNDAYAWFMYISDGGAKPPESCVFGQLLNLSAVFLALSSYLRHRQYIVYYGHHSKDRNGWWSTFSLIVMCIGFLSAFGMSLVANFQELAVATVHEIGAMMAFFGAAIYCWGNIFMSYALVPHMTPLWLNHIRTVLATIGTGALTLHMICQYGQPFVKKSNGVVPTEPPGNYIKKYDYNSPFYTNHLVTTCAEWALALSLETLVLTFAWELRQFYMNMPKMHMNPIFFASSLTEIMVCICWNDSRKTERTEHLEMFESAFTYNTDYNYSNNYTNWSTKNHYTFTKADEEAKLRDIKPNSVIELVFIALSFVALFVSDFERLVVLRLGKAQKVRGPGTFLVLPCIDKSVKIDISVNSYELPNISIITVDKGIVEFSSAVFLRVNDPVISHCNFQDKDTTIKNLAYTAIYKHLSKRTLHDITKPLELSKILKNVQEELNKYTSEMGVEIVEVTVTKINVHKEAENQAISLFNKFMKSDVGSSVFQNLQSQLLQNVSSTNGTDTQNVPAQPPPSQQPNASINVDMDLEELITKIRRCCDSNLVNRVGKRYRIICFGEDETIRGDFIVDLKEKQGWATWTSHAPDLLSDVDVTFSLSKQNLFALVSGELSPFTAYMNGVVQINGSVSDASGLKYLMERAREIRCMGDDRVLLLFDVDGTLTVPRQAITEDMKIFLREARNKADIAVVGGSDLSKIVEQLGELPLLQQDFNNIFSENGLVGYHGIEPLPTESIVDVLGEEKLQDVINFCLDYMSKIRIPCKRGNFVEFRRGMLNISPIGRSCSTLERAQFIEYEAKNPIRQQFMAALEERFKDYGLKFSIGGQISIDIFPIGWDKTYCLRFLTEKYKTIHFFGDKTMPGGNDFEIFEHPATIGHTVTSYQDTIRVVREVIDKL
ncbi:hypothetical protein FO519_000370 [Halicephalobus sp. NKZ332]|nr:hypothetical protein FO519_000370 [Halicephalobus sp. NKZ332]